MDGVWAWLIGCENGVRRSGGVWELMGVKWDIRVDERAKPGLLQSRASRSESAPAEWAKNRRVFCRSR